MIELGQLERRHADFARRNTRVVVVSMEGLEDAALTQSDFPHLLVLADADRGLSEAAGLIDPHAAPDGRDVDAPTTILTDRRGVVRWIYRSPGIIARLSPDEVLQAVERNLPATADATAQPAGPSPE
jgi:alkyl hydroperoxide reductase subunit AhpC